MRNWFLILFIISLSSCATFQFTEWNNSLVELEEELKSQKKESNQVAAPDVFLLKGVYNATKKKDAAPYPILKKIGDGIENEDKILSANCDAQLKKLNEFRAKHGEKSIKNIGPEWDDYISLKTALQNLTETNRLSLTNLHVSDNQFDSICRVNKIRSVPLLEYEAELADKITMLEDDFVALQNEFQRFKREITEKQDREKSMRAIGEMKQKIRRIESEQLQMSNLYSRLNSLRSDAMLFEGPYIDKTAEIKLIEDKTAGIQELLNQLRKMEERYEEIE